MMWDYSKHKKLCHVFCSSFNISFYIWHIRMIRIIYILYLVAFGRVVFLSSSSEHLHQSINVVFIGKQKTALTWISALSVDVS